MRNLLSASMQHVAVVLLGSRLQHAWQRHAGAVDELFGSSTSATTVQAAAATLVFNGSMSALDLCASALGRWARGDPGADREDDFADIKAKVVPAILPGWGEAWYSSVKGDARWQKLKAYRDGHTHRIIPRSVVVSPGAWPVYTLHRGDPADAGTSDPLVDLFAEVPVWVRCRWEAFWEDLAAEATPGDPGGS
jgi:hypothetical protein